MNIEEGFQINTPEVFVPWTITQDRLKQLLGNHGLKHITMGYFTLSCTSLREMSHELGFHFDPQTSNILSKLEFFQKEYSDQKKSYDSFQFHFEKEFGKPTEIRPGSEGFDTCIWRIGSVEISHSVYDRFGPEEHMIIKRTRENKFSITKPYHSFLSYFANSRSISLTILRTIGFILAFILALPLILVLLVCVIVYTLFQFLFLYILRQKNNFE